MSTVIRPEDKGNAGAIFASVADFENWLVRGVANADAIARCNVTAGAIETLKEARRIYRDCYVAQSGARWLAPARQSVVAGNGVPLQVVAVHPNDAHGNAVGFALNYCLRCECVPCELPETTDGGRGGLQLN